MEEDSFEKSIEELTGMLSEIICALIKNEGVKEACNILNECTDSVNSIFAIINLIITCNDPNALLYFETLLHPTCSKNQKKKIESQNVIDALDPLMTHFFEVKNENQAEVLSRGIISFISMTNSDFEEIFEMVLQFLFASESPLHIVIFGEFLIKSGFQNYLMLAPIIESCFDQGLGISSCLSTINAIGGENAGELYEITTAFFLSAAENSRIDIMNIFVNKFEEIDKVLLTEDCIDDILALLESPCDEYRYISMRILALLIKTYEYPSDSLCAITTKVIEECNSLFTPEEDISNIRINEIQDFFTAVLSRLSFDDSLVFIHQLMELFVSNAENEYYNILSILLAEASFDVSCGSKQENAVLFNFIEDRFYCFLDHLVCSDSSILHAYIFSFICELIKSECAKKLDYNLAIQLLTNNIAGDLSCTLSAISAISHCILKIENTDFVFSLLLERFFEYISSTEYKETVHIMFEFISIVFEKSSDIHSEEAQQVLQFIINIEEELDNRDFYKSITKFITFALRNEIVEFEDIHEIVEKSIFCCLTDDIVYYKSIAIDLIKLTPFWNILQTDEGPS